MSETSWPSVALKEIASEDKYAVVGGPFGSKLVSRDYVPEGVPVLRGANLPQDREIALDDLVFVTDEKVEKDLFGNLAHPGDIVVTQRGTLGQIGLLPDAAESPYDRYVVSQSQMKLTVDPRQADNRFVYYALRSPGSVKRIQDLGMSSGVPHINLDIFRNFEIRLPGLTIQRRVVNWLRRYDDLIENNRRRIEILEEMARLIYREWFVHLRFAGHEDVELVDSDLGPTPEGWKVERLGELATIEKGLSYKGAHLNAEGPPMANLKCLAPGGGFRREGTKPYDGPFKERHAVTAGDIVVANTDLTQAGNVIGSAARLPTAVFGDGGLLSHHLFRVRPRDGARVEPEYLLSALQDPRFHQWARSCASGTTVLGFRREDAEQYPVLVPDDRTTRRFEHAVQPITSLAENLEDQVGVLAEARDLLLPRLISGALDVSDLDLDLDSVA